MTAGTENGPGRVGQGRSTGGRPNHPGDREGPPTRRGGESSRHARIPASVIPSLATLPKRAVVVYLALAAHADKNGDGYPSRQQLAEGTGYSEQVVANTMGLLVRAGLVERKRVGARRWTFHLTGVTRVVTPGVTGVVTPKEQPNRTETSAPSGANRSRPDGHAPGANLSPMRSLPPTPGQFTLTGEVEQQQPDWPNEVRRAYFAAWKQAHGGQPPSAYTERMMGKVREVERSISRSGTEAEWPAWVEAARRAAALGAWDVVGHYPRPETARAAGKTARAMNLARRLDEMGA